MNLTTKLSRPWAITPAGFEDARRSIDAGLALSDFIVPRHAAGVHEETGEAFVHIKGALGDAMPPIWEKAGNTDYRTLRLELAAIRDKASSLTLVIDSPGGMVAGLAEAAQAIAAVGEVMPVRARVDGMACSAAYYLACAADTIEASPSSDVGNIGTVMAWMDATDFFESMGATFNVLTNEGADLKGMFHTAGRLSESQIAFLQDQVNEMGADFRAVVEGARPDIDPEVFRAGWYSGEKAKSLGLIDSIV
jgi:protease-4